MTFVAEVRHGSGGVYEDVDYAKPPKEWGKSDISAFLAKLAYLMREKGPKMLEDVSFHDGIVAFEVKVPDLSATVRATVPDVPEQAVNDWQRSR